jgi:Tfp pilus assembly major pilin PilA
MHSYQRKFGRSSHCPSSRQRLLVATITCARQCASEHARPGCRHRGHLTVLIPPSPTQHPVRTSSTSRPHVASDHSSPPLDHARGNSAACRARPTHMCARLRARPDARSTHDTARTATRATRHTIPCKAVASTCSAHARGLLLLQVPNEMCATNTAHQTHTASHTCVARLLVDRPGVRSTSGSTVA